jgi:tRNA (cytidine/uridine-2'-O-)-methyltransferase
MFSLILYEPEIPPNTGNIIRLCANTGVQLHLVEPLGFKLDEPRLKRAGLDYREFARVATHASLEACLDSLGGPRLFALSTRAGTRYDSADYKQGDAFLFGPETRGLPQEVLESVPPGRRLRLPMQENSRSLAAALTCRTRLRLSSMRPGDSWASRVGAKLARCCC